MTKLCTLVIIASANLTTAYRLLECINIENPKKKEVKKVATNSNKQKVLDKIFGLWDEYAPEYMPTFGNLGMFRRFAKKTMKSLLPRGRKGNWLSNLINWFPRKEQVIPAEGVVLDGGCGPGSNFEKIIETTKPQLLMGLDCSEEMLREAEKVRERLNRRNGCIIKLVKADLCQGIPFPDNYFDVQLYHLVLYYLPFGGWRKVIPEIFRVTKPNGYVVTTDFLKGYSFRRTIEKGWLPIAWAFMEITHFLAYIRFMRRVKPILLEIQRLEEEGMLEFPSEPELIATFKKAGFERIEITAKLMGGGIVLRAFKPGRMDVNKSQ